MDIPKSRQTAGMRRSKAKSKHLFIADRCQASVSLGHHRLPTVLGKNEWELISKKKQMLWECGLLEKEKDGARLVVKSHTSCSLRCAGENQSFQRYFSIVMSVLCRSHMWGLLCTTVCPVLGAGKEFFMSCIISDCSRKEKKRTGYN